MSMADCSRGKLGWITREAEAGAKLSMVICSRELLRVFGGAGVSIVEEPPNRANVICALYLR